MAAAAATRAMARGPPVALEEPLRVEAGGRAAMNVSAPCWAEAEPWVFGEPGWAFVAG